MSKTFPFPKKIDNNFDVSFPRLFLLSRFRVFLSDGSTKYKNTTKNVSQKVVSKRFYKKSTKKFKTDFFSILF
jgi:hypothetical protein